MSKARRFDNIWVQSAPSLDLFSGRFCQQMLCEATANLGNFQRVGQAVVEDITLAGRRHLGNPAEAAELR